MTTVPSSSVPDRATEQATAGALATVPRLLRSEPALAALIGAADATVAVPEAAQAVVAAALAAFTQRTPLLVITATGLDAERLGDDLSCLIDPDDGSGEGGAGPVVGALAGPVVVLPAWETLPFERVSPETETMGRRLAVLRALTGAPDPTLPPTPRVIVAPVRAVLQRLGPLEGTAPTVIRPGQQVDVGELLPALVAMGYRREHQVEHRGEFAVRGGIVDVFPSTADAPVRIDLWGDEVDRLTAFSVSDQRSSHDLRAVALYGCRELVITPALRDAASALVTRRPWGASVWENLAEGTQFDGMESWLPFLDDTARVLPDLLPPGAQVVLVEPRRIRDRGVQLLDEEAALAETLAATWGAKEADPLHPDQMVFDLDPGDGVAFAEVVNAARDVRERLHRVKLESFCRTTGGKGLHLVVPLKPAAGWDQVKQFCRAFAETLSEDQPKRFLSTVKKVDRQGRILIDWLRNGLGATAVASYCPRARPGAGVAMPLAWDDVTTKLDPTAFTLRNTPQRLARQKRDPWAGFETARQPLPALAEEAPKASSGSKSKGSSVIVTAAKPKRRR